MRHFTRSALVAAAPERLFALINDVEHYPEFVPWCVGSQLLSRTGTEVVARLDVKRSLLRTSFTTRNTLVEPDGVTMTLVEGPFRMLEGHWVIKPISDASGASLGSRVSLEMRFEIASSLTSALLEPVFEETVASLVDAFVARARATQVGQDRVGQ
jgi:ribosome-associated toxin RatA of RatAB toxin-antitoxin module